MVTFRQSIEDEVSGEGETMADLLQQANGQGLLVEEVLLIAEQLCSVLDYLHTRHPPIIFRDLKPTNVMITFNSDHLYLIDFGIARFFKTGQLHDTHAYGTSGYAAPEQYGGQTTVRSDIYSLGVTLHQMLTGIEPLHTHAPFQFAPIRTYNQQAPPTLEKLVMQMVEIDPMRRPPSMLSIKQEIQRIKQGTHNTPLIQTIESSHNNVVVAPPPKSQRGTTLCKYWQHTDSVYAVTWAPNGKYVASGSRDKTVQVWNAVTSNKIFTYTNHFSYIYGVAWSPDGKRIASGSEDKTVHVWQAM